MNYEKQIKKLKDQGYRIKSKTLRYSRQTGQLIPKKGFEYKKGENEIDPHGGIIDVYLEKEDKSYRGSSVCCKGDLFVRKEGFKRAFWDAYANLMSKDSK